MLVIRFQRAGRKKNPFYRIVVAEKSRSVKGRFIERVGHYNPLSQPKDIFLKNDRIEHWISVGATPSQTAARLFAKNGIVSVEKFIEKRVTKQSKEEREAQEKAKQEAEETAQKAAEEKAAAEAAKAASEEKKAAEEKPEESATPEETKEEEQAKEQKEEKADDEAKEKKE